MPPKKKVPQPSDKNKAKAKSKNAEDKTFGLKNKNKSKRVQLQINQIVAGADGGAQKRKEAEAKRKAEEKKAAELAKKEAAVSMGIQQPKVPFGVDPKSILCEFFKNGVCNKGTKCKFSHDLDVGRKVVKKDLYTDARAEKEEDTMDNWDEEKLRKVILSKHGNPKTTTDIVCKYFIEAVENGKYGWFWVCPNGGNECKYRHSLPPGFVLKTKEEKRLERLAQENAPKITLEEFIEMERGRLDRTKFTPITWATFTEWKKRIKAKRDDDRKKEDEKNKRLLTGREIIQKKFADKYYTEEGDAESGEAWDLSVFRKDLPEEDDENIKDYGDGADPFSKMEEEQLQEVVADAAAEVPEAAEEASSVEQPETTEHAPVETPSNEPLDVSTA